MLKQLTPILWLLMLAGCYKTEVSEPLIEEGVVVETVFRPYHYHTSTYPVTSTDAKGNVHVTYETSTDYYSDQHWVVFACQHGEFAVDNEAAWKTVHPGMKVKIKYRQIDTYQEKKGQKIHVGTDYEFESCWPAKAEMNVADVILRVVNREKLK